MVYKITVACKNPSKKAWTVLAKDRISYISGYVQGDPKRCVPMKISIVTLIKKLFISNYNHTQGQIIIIQQEIAIV